MADKIEKSIAPKTVAAHARNLRIAPRKLRLVANSVKKMAVGQALQQLSFTNKKGAPIVSKLIRSAIANAEHNFSFAPETLFISSITCDQGQVMMRYMPRARGSASPLRRKMSHLHIVLGVNESLAKKAKASRLAGVLRRAKTEKKPEVVEAESPVTEREGIKGPEVTKTNEKIKQGKIQQKRRLFNRKSGE